MSGWRSPPDGWRCARAATPDRATPAREAGPHGCLDQPGGWLLVGIVAAGFLAAAAMQAKKAWDGSFARELAGDVPVPDHVCTAGRVGYGARALVFLIVAGFFLIAAWQTDASEAGRVEAALGTLQSQPGGAWLLGAVGAGLMLFGVYGFVEARYRRIRVRVPG